MHRAVKVVPAAPFSMLTRGAWDAGQPGPGQARTGPRLPHRVKCADTVAGRPAPGPRAYLPFAGLFLDFLRECSIIASGPGNTRLV